MNWQLRFTSRDSRTGELPRHLRNKEPFPHHHYMNRCALFDAKGFAPNCAQLGNAGEGPMSWPRPMVTRRGLRMTAHEHLIGR